VYANSCIKAQAPIDDVKLTRSTGRASAGML